MTRAAERWTTWCGLAALAVACQKTPFVSCEVVLGQDVASAAQWVEVGVLPGGCPSNAALSEGLPASGEILRVAFGRNQTPPTFGDLKKGTYGFAAVARDGSCTVVGSGCATVDVSSTRDVSITVDAVQQGGGACASGETCLDARCVPSLAQADADIGAGCSLVVLGGGPLGDPLDLSGSDFTGGPAITPTETGFLVAYREYDQLGGAARLTVAAIDAGGGLTVPTPTALPSQCPQQDESDAVGLAYAQGTGLVVSARPACSGPSPGFDTFQVDAGGNVVKSAFTSVMGAKPALSPAHALAMTDPQTAWLAYLENGAAGLATVSGLAEKSPMPFGGAPPQSTSMVAAGAKMIALLAVGTGTAMVDGGMPPDAGGGSTARLALGTTPSMTGEPVSPFPATWGAVAVDGTRAFVMTDAPSNAQQVAWVAADLGGMGPAASGTFGAVPGATVLGGDVAFRGDTAAFAVEQPGNLSVVGFTKATAMPTMTQTVSLAGDPHVPSLRTLRDGRVAIASNGTQVAVVWLTGKSIGMNDPLGGYAVLACAP